MKLLKRSVLLLLALALSLCTFASCASEKAAMKYGDTELSESDYAYIMAFVKGYYEYYYSYMSQYYGVQFNMSEMYDQDMGNGMTMAESMTDAINEQAKMLLVVEQLCKEAGLFVEDSDSYAEIAEVMQTLEDDYGGRDALAIELAKLGLKSSSVERYEKYNLLLSLLKDYRYGENGVARISEEEVKKAFEEQYVKAEGYLFPFIDGNKNSVLYDFAADYAYADVKTFFAENFVIDYVSFADETKAADAYAALSAGDAELSDYFDSCKQRAESRFTTELDLSESLYAGVEAIGEDAWYLSEKEGDYYYVIYRHAVTTDLLDEDMEEAVRDAMVTRDAHAFFLENYVTVQHILMEDEAKAKAAYEAIVAGTKTLKDYEKENKDSGMQYTFTEGTMVKEFETAAYELEVGKYTLVKTDYGFHILTRLELDESGFVAKDALAAMSREKMRTEAASKYEALVGGEAFAKPEEGAIYTYSEPSLLVLAEQDATMKEALEKAENGELVKVEVTGYGVFLLRKSETTDEDLEKIYDDVAEPLIENAFYEYLGTFYDSVRVDESITGKFDIRTAKTFYY